MRRAEIAGSYDCEMKRSRLLMAASGAAIVTLVPVLLYQLGAIDHLPDPPSKLFDSDRITDSRMARPLGIPDGLLGIASYGTTMALILIAGKAKRAHSLLGAKLLMDGGAAAFNASRQIVRFRKICSWCMGTVAATAVMVYAGHQLIMGMVSRRCR